MYFWELVLAHFKARIWSSTSKIEDLDSELGLKSYPLKSDSGPDRVFLLGLEKKSASPLTPLRVTFTLHFHFLGQK